MGMRVIVSCQVMISMTPVCSTYDFLFCILYLIGLLASLSVWVLVGCFQGVGFQGGLGGGRVYSNIHRFHLAVHALITRPKGMSICQLNLSETTTMSVEVLLVKGKSV